MGNATKQESFDVIVIGGGIHGAGCAQALAAAGYRVCILEQNTWGSGTSSRSSKLVHGGLRYLETYQFGLVRKSLNERRILLKIAEKLLHPLPFFIPVYQSSKRQPWEVFLGLSLYSVLGGLDRLSRFRCVPRREWADLNGLSTVGLKQVFQYWDTQTNDQLLTRAVVDSAEKLGATLLEHTCFSAAQPDTEGYLVTYTQNRIEQQIHSRIIVNAAGAWATEVQAYIGNAPPPPAIELVKGAHIILSGQLSNAAFYVESPRDHRAMFVLPWHGNTLVGTTETAFNGDPAKVVASDDEIRYLLEAVHQHFPDFKCEIVNSFAGVRVLPKQAGNFSSRPRETLIQCDDKQRPSLISLYGGKLTTYRVTADEILQKVLLSLGRKENGKSTRTIFLTT